MAVDPAALDKLFEGRGGFDAAYESLVALAASLLRTYGGDSAARVVLRQYHPEEIADEAFYRLFTEGFEEGKDPYYAVRNHIRNFVRGAAKSKTQAKLKRVDGSTAGTQAYHRQTDLNEQTSVERVMIIDDIEFCTRVMQQLVSDLKNQEEHAIATAIIAGFRQPDEICQLNDMPRPTFDAAFKRLKRKFAQVCASMTEDSA